MGWPKDFIILLYLFVLQYNASSAYFCNSPRGIQIILPPSNPGPVTVNNPPAPVSAPVSINPSPCSPCPCRNGCCSCSPYNPVSNTVQQSNSQAVRVMIPLYTAAPTKTNIIIDVSETRPKPQSNNTAPPPKTNTTDSTPTESPPPTEIIIIENGNSSAESTAEATATAEADVNLPDNTPQSNTTPNEDKPPNDTKPTDDTPSNTKPNNDTPPPNDSKPSENKPPNDSNPPENTPPDNGTSPPADTNDTDQNSKPKKYPEATEKEPNKHVRRQRRLKKPPQPDSPSESPPADSDTGSRRRRRSIEANSASIMTDNCTHLNYTEIIKPGKNETNDANVKYSINNEIPVINGTLQEIIPNNTHIVFILNSDLVLDFVEISEDNYDKNLDKTDNDDDLNVENYEALTVISDSNKGKRRRRRASDDSGNTNDPKAIEEIQITQGEDGSTNVNIVQTMHRIEELDNKTLGIVIDMTVCSISVYPNDTLIATTIAKTTVSEPNGSGGSNPDVDNEKVNDDLINKVIPLDNSKQLTLNCTNERMTIIDGNTLTASNFAEVVAVLEYLKEGIATVLDTVTTIANATASAEVDRENAGSDDDGDYYTRHCFIYYDDEDCPQCTEED